MYLASSKTTADLGLKIDTTLIQTHTLLVGTPTKSGHENVMVSDNLGNNQS